MGTVIVTVTDFDGDTDTLDVKWTVAEDLTPTFTGSVSEQKWVKGVSIATIGSLTVPAATGWDAPLSYSASGPPAGVSMSSSRSVSGTPTATGTGAATITVTDCDGDTDTLRFNKHCSTCTP